MVIDSTNPLLIGVYAIYKNESKFLQRWLSSILGVKDISGDESSYFHCLSSDHQYITVTILDTGSTPEELAFLKDYVYAINHRYPQLTINVFESKDYPEATPFRFDTARNLCLSLVPFKKQTMLMFSIDLDETVSAGWYGAIYRAICAAKVPPSKVKYHYWWAVNEDDTPRYNLIYEKIHSADYVWHLPVHEELVQVSQSEPGPELYIEDLIVKHFPDSSKSRSQYLDLLKISVEENPDNDRPLLLLARELLWANDIKGLSFSTRYFARFPNAWYVDRINMYMTVAEFYKRKADYEQCIKYLKYALSVSKQYGECRQLYAVLAFTLHDCISSINDAVHVLKYAGLAKRSKIEYTYIENETSSDASLNQLIDRVLVFIDKNTK